MKKSAPLRVLMNNKTFEFWRKGLLVHYVVELSQVGISVGMFDDPVIETMRLLNGFKPSAEVLG
jgi:hypothetical protein